VQLALEENSGVVGPTASVRALIADHSTSTERAVRTGLEDIAGDGRVADLNDICGDPFNIDPLVGEVEALLLRSCHARRFSRRR